MNENESNAISAARAIAIVLVVVGHAMTFDIRNSNTVINYLWTIIYSFHMFFFFFLSGLLFEKGVNKYNNSRFLFLQRKFQLLVVPYIAITVIEYVGLFLINLLLQLMGKEGNIYEISIKSFANALIFNEGHFDTHLWYVYSLFILFLINILIPKRKYMVPLIVISVALVIIYPYLSIFPWKIQNIIYYIVPFAIGRLSYHKRFLESIIERGSRLKVFLGCTYILMVNCIIYYLEKIFTGKLFGVPYIRVGLAQELKYTTGIVGSILLINIGHKTIQMVQLKKILRNLDMYSYEIYLYHQPFVTVGCATVLMKLQCPVLVNILLSTSVGIIVPMVLSRFIFRKNELLCKVFLGNH